MADLDVVIFTFTDTEATAVESLLASYFEPGTDGSTPWKVRYGSRVITRALPGGRVVQLEHRPLRAQGNVTAAAELARAAYSGLGARDKLADWYIFYGCCGAIDSKFVGEVFRVSRVAYLSLGSVTNGTAPVGGSVASIPAEQVMPASEETSCNAVNESVRLKNKWIVRTDPGDQPPLSSIALPAGSVSAAGPLMFLDIREAFVLATDKVIKIPPAAVPPTSSWSDASGHVYQQGEWSYGQALAHCKDEISGPILIDMETFGIASTMRAMGLDERVLVLRVVTDALINKAGQPDGHQLEMLQKRLPQLDEVLATIMGLADDAK